MFIYKNKDLQKAMDYKRQLEKLGIIKDFILYEKMLDEYAAQRGFYTFNDLIKELLDD